MFSISYDKFTLPNGLDVMLHQDHSLPIVAVNLWYHVGSKNEQPGRTGFAHLFEHVMFEGSKHHNQSFFNPLQEAGANINGSTTADRTNYWINAPSNYIELCLWLESDRMGFLLEALDQKRFDIQREVVKNERRQSYETQPYGMAHMALQPAVFPHPHPYNWPTIGSQEDLNVAKLDDVKAFFQNFYSPSNASLTIAGDINVDHVRQLVEQYFGDIPPGPTIDRLGKMDSTLKGEVSLTLHDKVHLPRLYLTWPTYPLFTPEQASLDILSTVLGDGKGSRLYRSLVYDKQIALDLTVFDHSQEIAGEFLVQVTANPGHSLEEIETSLQEELERIRKEPITETELTRAKNIIENSHIRQLEQIGGFGGRADQLNFYNMIGQDPQMINSDISRYKEVTSEDVQRVASSALGSNFVRLSVLPEKPLQYSETQINRTKMPKATKMVDFAPPVPWRMKLSNGLNVLVVQKPDLPLVTFGLLMKTGAYIDPVDKPGLSRTTALMLLEGTLTRSRQDITDEMEYFGSQLNVSTRRTHMIISAETLKSHWEKAFEIMSDVAMNPSFDSTELERIRKEIITDLKQIPDSPSAISTRATNSLWFGPDSKYGHPINGTVASIQNTNQDDLRKHFINHYNPQNATLIVVGDITPEDVTSKIEGNLAQWTSSKIVQTTKRSDFDSNDSTPTTIFLADKPGSAQSIIRIGHLTISRNHTDFYAMNLLNYIFGGQFSARLNMNLRQDKGYSYGYTSSIAWNDGPSAFVSGGAVQTEVTREAIIETLKEFFEIRDLKPITEEEFTAAMDGITKSLPSHFESQLQTLNQLTLLSIFNLPDNYFENFADNLRSVSIKDVQRVASDRLVNNHLKILVVGDRNSIEPELKKLDLPIVPVDYDGRVL